MSRAAKVGILAAGVASVLAGAGVAVARYAVFGRRRPMRAVFRSDAGTVVLPHMDATVQPRTFGLQRGRDLFRVEQIMHEGETTIERRVEGSDLEGEADVYYVGDVFGRESELARSAIVHNGATNGVSFVHWDVMPDAPTDPDLWFVHVHGMGAAPISTLRSVESVRQAGHPSTIVSLDAHADIDERSRGMSPEHLPRVLAAIDHALHEGAQQIVLVGWSYGARLALEAAALRPTVAGAILIAPMLDFVEVFRRVAALQRLPRVLIAAAALVLSTPVICRLAGIARPAGRGFDLSEAPRTLIFHSQGDATVPLAITRASATRFPVVEVVEFPPGPHTLEWNVDRELFERSIRGWLERIGEEGARRGAR